MPSTAARSASPARLGAPLLLASLVAAPAAAQAIEFDAVSTGKVPGSYITYPAGLNDHGVVVGMGMFVPGGLKGWTWTEGGGFTILPDPPGQPDFGAIDITIAGVIAGDGGGDSGRPWRYENGVYEMQDVLPGTAFAKTIGISEQGSVAGTCYGTLFYTPHHSFLAVKGASSTSILDDSYAEGINASDQVVGRIGWDAYRYTPGVGIELLPPLGDKDRLAAYGVNDLDEVAGEWEPTSGNRKPWVWSATRGVRFLQERIDPALGLKLHNVLGINNAGQILCRGYDANNDLVGMLLTPLDLCADVTKYCGAAQNPANAAGIDLDTCDSASDSILVSLTGGPAGQFAYLLVGDGNGTVSQPPGAVGDLCVVGGSCLGRYDKDVGQIDAFGTFTTDLRAAASNPCAGAVVLAPGSTWNFQYWHRQPMGQPATFSEAMTVTFH